MKPTARTTSLILLTACMAGTSSAAIILEQWSYDEVTAGLSLHQVANSGTVGTTYPTTWNGEFATDGAGNLDIKPGTGGYKTSSAFTALSGTDTYSLEIKVAQWDIPAANTAQARLQWRMNASPNVIEIQTLLDPTNGLGFTFVSDGTNYRTHWIGGASGTDAQARIDFNVAGGWATYFANGAEKETFSSLTFASMTSFLMQKSDFNNVGVDAATVLKIDQQTLSVDVIPEPGTLGLVFLSGLALLARRRFR